MPFTPFHFGPALLIGYPLRRRMDFLTFVVANVILDLRPALVFLGVLAGPRHGWFHNTYLGALVVALVFAAIVLLLYRQFPSIAQQISSRSSSPKAVVLASVAGTWLHVTLDAFTHSGMQPFYPLAGNPLYGMIGGVILYGLCVLAFIVFVGIFGISLVRKRRKYDSIFTPSNGGPSRNLVAGVFIGIVLAMVIVVGASATIDAVQGLDTPNVTVERINSTHAAVTWTTEKPTYGVLKTSVARECGPAWGRRETINKINGSSLSRTHLIVAPIYGLNKSQVDLASIPGNGPLRWYQVSAISVGERERPYTSIVQRNLTQTCH